MDSSHANMSRHSILPRGLLRRIRRRRSDINAAPEAYGKTPSLPNEEFYPTPIDQIRSLEYPHMTEGVYLDHSGATIYAKSLIDAFTTQLSSNLYGNPHSANRPAERSGRMVDHVRDKTLRFLGADPQHFDLIFVANATAAIKLVADSFRDLAEHTRSGDFWYGYHKDSHTSLVGIRELTHDHSHCFESDDEVDRWLADPEKLQLPQAKRRAHDQFPRHNGLGLFAYPAQSNMSGRRLPLSWPGQTRSSPALQGIYTLLDCAALAMTSPLHKVFQDPESAPDFSCVSFYKVFGFPDLGALIVRKDSGHVLTLRKYFGGGTVTMVSVLGGTWHKIKGRDAMPDPNIRGPRQDHGHDSYEIHDSLEDGTLPFHSILALGEAIDVHTRLYGSMHNVSRHTTALSMQLHQSLRDLKHINGRTLCHIYADDDGNGFGDPMRQGATIAFNLLDSQGHYVPYSDVERISNDHKIFLRSGGLCCPGGLFTALEYEPWQLQRAFSAHHTCGPDGLSLIQQLPTGVVRASLGAMSTREDIDTFISFLRKKFVNQEMGSTVTSISQEIKVAGDEEKVVEDGEEDRNSEDTIVSVI